jgi:Protein of unknown function (DUF1566)
MSMKQRIFFRAGSTILVLATAVLLGALIASSSSANAPTGRFVIGTGTQANSVADTVTGLTWMRAPDVPMTWPDSLTRCADMSLAGYSDWRVATIKELHTLIDESRFNPALDTDAFPAVTGGYYWSSTTLPWDSTTAIVIDLNTGGSLTIEDALGYTYRFLCVR